LLGALVAALALMTTSCGGTDPAGVEPPDPARAHHIVAYDDVTIEVVAEGAGPPLLLLPSLGRDSYDYDEVAAGLAANGFRVLRPQPRGIGRSTGPIAALTLHDFARDVAAVIERENAGPAVTVGHAYGHVVATTWARRLPG
jgi:pimeloyl-ACP methyl ester carboxylesterase